MRILCLAALVLATSCSLRLDSQYGIRIEPAPRGPQERATSRVQTSQTDAAKASEISAETNPTVVEFDAGQKFWESEQPLEASVAPSASHHGPTEAFDQAEHPEFDAVDDLQPYETSLADAAPRSEPNMLTAWLMWGIPVVLMLAGLGFLLNFGLHWYYLGKQRRANSATFIWALTLAGFVAVGLLRLIQLGLLAFLVFLIALIPLMVIQLIRAVKDAVLLNKISTRKARRAERNRGSSI